MILLWPKLALSMLQIDYAGILRHSIIFENLKNFRISLEILKLSNKHSKSFYECQKIRNLFHTCMVTSRQFPKSIRIILFSLERARITLKVRKSRLIISLTSCFFERNYKLPAVHLIGKRTREYFTIKCTCTLQ